MPEIFITIGRKNTNDIVIEDESISNYHAQATYDGEGKVTLFDIDSTNGIHVNNRRIQKKQIDEKDQVILGKLMMESSALIADIKAQYLEKKTDFSEEFEVIIDKLKAFSNAKDKMNSSSNLSNIIRVGLVLIIIGVLTFIPDLIESDSTRIMLMIGAGLVPVVFSIFSLKGEKKRVALDMLKLEYEEVTKCPKCSKSLLNYTAEYLIKKGKCPIGDCDTKFEIV